MMTTTHQCHKNLSHANLGDAKPKSGLLQDPLLQPRTATGNNVKCLSLLV